MELWSNIVLILSACSLVVPAPVPQFMLPMTPPYNYISFARSPYPNISGSPAEQMILMNPDYPAQVVMGAQSFNPRNPFNVPSTGLPGGLNTLSAGIINTGLALSSAFASAMSGITTTLGNFATGALGDGSINDQFPNYNNQRP